MAQDAVNWTHLNFESDLNWQMIMCTWNVADYVFWWFCEEGFICFQVMTGVWGFLIALLFSMVSSSSLQVQTVFCG